MEGVIAKSASVWQQKFGEAKMTKDELIEELGNLAIRFSKGWHEGIKIDASDIMLFNQIAEALAKEKALQALHDENERLGLYKDAYAEQEPMAWISTGPARMIHWTSDKPAYGDDWVPLYAAPPQRKPLTLGQKQRLWSSVGDKPTLKDRVNAYGLAIEAAHGIKE